jgi:hypothetical protein
MNKRLSITCQAYQLKIWWEEMSAGAINNQMIMKTL